ncbi:MAG: hypothetical protein JW839_19020 [Candidatus Lokiarchaeota archaeon]|nr:hypothetical protein [Candidatus Lokiarchaeota archaeon]
MRGARGGLEPLRNRLRNGTARGFTSKQNLVDLYAKAMERLGTRTWRSSTASRRMKALSNLER